MGALGLSGGLEAEWCILLGVSLIQMRSNAWSRGVARGVTEGFRSSLFQGIYSLTRSWCQYCEGPLALASNPLNLSADWTGKPRAPVWFSSPEMHFLTQERPHQLTWLCLKARICCVQGHFFFSHAMPLRPWPHLPRTAMQQLMDLLTKCLIMRVSSQGCRGWSRGLEFGQLRRYEMGRLGSGVPGKVLDAVAQITNNTEQVSTRIC